MNADSNEKQPLRDTIKKKLTPLICKKFEAFAKDLIKGKYKEFRRQKQGGNKHQGGKSLLCISLIIVDRS